jgi:putative Holliday junction resolvase
VSARPRTALGFDYGQRKIGVAVGQELTASARPLTALKTQQGQAPWAAIAQLIEDWRPAILVVGVPYQADGSANAITRAALAFSRELEERFQLPVATIDERLSSHEAAQQLAAPSERRAKAKAKGAIDALAAALILESWWREQPTAAD